MNLKNGLTYPIPVPPVPEELESKIILRFTAELTEYEANLYRHCLRAVVDQLKHDGLDFTKLSKATVIFTQGREVAIDFSDDNAFGYRINFVIYRVDQWREHGYEDLNLALLFLEELCHHYYNIEDEGEVKRKVIEIVKRSLNPDATFEAIYKPNFMDYYKDS